MHVQARRYVRSVLHVGIVGILLAIASVGWGSIKNTPEQESTLGALHACDHCPGVWIDRVDASGRYWVKQDDQDNWRRFQECVAAQRLDTSKAQHAQAARGPHLIARRTAARAPAAKTEVGAHPPCRWFHTAAAINSSAAVAAGIHRPTMAERSICRRPRAARRGGNRMLLKTKASTAADIGIAGSR